jgi:hypothetical protein
MTNNIRDIGYADPNKIEAVNNAYPWIIKRMAGTCKVLFLSIS